MPRLLAVESARQLEVGSTYSLSVYLLYLLAVFISSSLKPAFRYASDAVIYACTALELLLTEDLRAVATLRCLRV